MQLLKGKALVQLKGKGVVHLVDESFGSGRAHKDVKAGLRAKLPQTLRAGTHKSRSDCVRSLANGALQHHDGIHAAHLSIHWDGHRACCAGVHERPAAHARTCEAYCGKRRLLGELLADVDAIAHEEGKGAVGQIVAARGRYDDVGYKLGSARVSVVGHDNHGASGGKGRRCVASSYRVRKRKIGRAKHADGAERNAHGTEIRSGNGLSFRLSSFDAGAGPFPLLANIGEKAQLIHSAPDLRHAAGIIQR